MSTMSIMSSGIYIYILLFYRDQLYWQSREAVYCHIHSASNDTSVDCDLEAIPNWASSGHLRRCMIAGWPCLLTVNGNPCQQVDAWWPRRRRSYHRSDMARPKLIDYRLIFTLNSYIFSKKPRIDYLECIFVISIKFYVDIGSKIIG